MNRLICTFLIAWLALLSVGSQAYATGDAAHELSHLSFSETDKADVAGIHDIVTVKADPAHGHDHADTCSHSHQSGVPTSSFVSVADAGSTSPVATLRSWDSRDRLDSIERPKWFLTTPAVVNLQS